MLQCGVTRSPHWDTGHHIKQGSDKEKMAKFEGIFKFVERDNNEKVLEQIGKNSSIIHFMKMSIEAHQSMYQLV